MLIKRTTGSGSDDLITVFRPCKVSEMVGHDINKNIIGNGLVKGTTPHIMLFTGPPGCGKTTAARIISLGLNCESTDRSTDTPCLECSSCISTMNHNNMDVIEINVGKSGGKDAVDRLTENLVFAPFSCRNKVLIFDEAHKLTSAAQDLLLKEIEDGYSHVYFIFCTNKPEKLESAFRSRTSMGAVHFGALSHQLMEQLLANICDYEGVEYNPAILRLIIDGVKGVPRDGIGVLKKVIDEGSWDEVNVKALLGELLGEEDINIMEMGKAISRGSFSGALKVLTALKDVPEEQVRIAMAGFFTSRLKWAKTTADGDKMSSILDVMVEPILMTGKPAHHALVNKLYKAARVVGSGL